MTNISKHHRNSVGIEALAGTRILLIMDDNPAVTSMLCRMLKLHVHRVYIAREPSEAVFVLKAISVTHMVVDENFGETEIKGSEFLRLYRKRCPSLQRAVIYTGVDPSSVPRYKEIDAVVSKTAAAEDLRAELGF